MFGRSFAQSFLYFKVSLSATFQNGADDFVNEKPIFSLKDQRELRKVKEGIQFDSGVILSISCL